MYDPPGLANSHAISCPLRASLAHLLFLAGFCSSQNWPCSSVKVRRLVCPSRSAHVFMSANTGINPYSPADWQYDCSTPQEEATMADNLKDRGPQDRARINVNEDWELRYWTKELGVNEDRLRKAVEKVGTSTDAVRKELAKP